MSKGPSDWNEFNKREAWKKKQAGRSGLRKLAFTIPASAFNGCPVRNLTARHWREDGTCECFPPKG